MNYRTRHIVRAASQSLTRSLGDPRAQIDECMQNYCFVFFISIIGCWRYIVYAGAQFYSFSSLLFSAPATPMKKKECSVSASAQSIVCSFNFVLAMLMELSNSFSGKCYSHHISFVCSVYALFWVARAVSTCAHLRFCFLSHSIRMCNARWANALRRDLCYMFCLHFVFNFVRPQSTRTWACNVCRLPPLYLDIICIPHSHLCLFLNISNKSQLKMLFTSIICSSFFLSFIRANGIWTRDDRSPFVIDHTHTSTAYMYSFVVQRSPVASNYFYYSFDERNNYSNYLSLSHSSALVHRPQTLSSHVPVSAHEFSTEKKNELKSLNDSSIDEYLYVFIVWECADECFSFEF